MTTPSREHPLSAKLESIEWEEFYREHHPKVLNLLIGILKDHTLAQEAAQNAFIKAVEKIREVEASARMAWLYRVAINEAWDIRRKRQTEQKHIQQAAQKAPQVIESESAAELLRQEQIQQLQKAIEQLPPEQKTVVLMRMRDDRTFADIAHQLKVPLGTILTRMRLAIDKLRKSMQEDDR